MTGWIEGKLFRLRAASVDVDLETEEVGADEGGRFALVRKGTFPLRDDYMLVTHPEHDYSNGTELVLEVRGQFPSLTEWRNLDFESLKTMKPQRSWCVYATPWGNIDGAGS